MSPHTNAKSHISGTCFSYCSRSGTDAQNQPRKRQQNTVARKDLANRLRQSVLRMGGLSAACHSRNESNFRCRSRPSCENASFPALTPRNRKPRSLSTSPTRATLVPRHVGRYTRETSSPIISACVADLPNMPANRPYFERLPSTTAAFRDRAW